MRLWDMGIRTWADRPTEADPPWPGPAGQHGTGGQGADEAVTGLYQAHALGLTRLAHIMLGDRAAAEDVVQEAFCGLYRRWSKLADPARALPYVRSSVLNGCRTILRRRPVREAASQLSWAGPAAAFAPSAEASVLSGEDAREVMQAIRALPNRQREALVLRFYLDLSDNEIATAMGISPGSVRSNVHRALAALGRSLGGTR
jgi:RNA polymerase sigma-70 factor (sigma-E family)